MVLNFQTPSEQVKHDLGFDLRREAALLRHVEPPCAEQMLPHSGICPVQGVHYTFSTELIVDISRSPSYNNIEHCVH
jgi:hypothetical protein